ncbi:MAG: EVE domain-containing protein [Bacteroidia bacterium]|nr:EVE domain-containing protein [Bacteroidia bacterium]HRI40979.1 EVE domain-containing protein [Bacteroidia bacterium]
MAYWLVKSDPDTYGWSDLVRDKKTTWDGVRNHLAKRHLSGMKKGDQVLFYHSGKESAIVAIAEVANAPKPEPNAPDWICVDLVPLKPLKQPVTLKAIKAEKKLADFPLVKIGRLSVMPVAEAAFDLLVAMGS